MQYRQFLLSVFGGFLGALLLSLLPLPGRATRQSPPAVRPEGTVTVSELRLVDSKGQLRAQLGMAAEGTPGFWLYDDKGVARLTFGLYPDSTSYFGLQDEHGQMIELLRSFGPKNSPLLIFKQGGADKMLTGLNPGADPVPFLMTHEPDGGRKVHFGKYEGP